MALLQYPRRRDSVRVPAPEHVYARQLEFSRYCNSAMIDAVIDGPIDDTNNGSCLSLAFVLYIAMQYIVLLFCPGCKAFALLSFGIGITNK